MLSGNYAVLLATVNQFDVLIAIIIIIIIIIPQTVLALRGSYLFCYYLGLAAGFFGPLPLGSGNTKTSKNVCF